MWKHRIERAVPLVLVTSICWLLSVEVMSDFFIYRRSDILHEEYWRLITGNFVHLNWQHLSLNLAAWFLIWVYGVRVCGISAWSLLLLLCAAGVGVGIFFGLPEIEEYSGLSGVLHGMFVAIPGLHLLINRSDYSAWAILTAVIAKLISEEIQGASGITADWIGLMIIPEAHLYGALSGLLIIIATALYGVVWGEKVSRK